MTPTRMIEIARIEAARTGEGGRGPETLLETDPRLYELVRQVISSTKMPGNVYVGRVRQPQPPGNTSAAV